MAFLWKITAILFYPSIQLLSLGWLIGDDREEIERICCDWVEMQNEQVAPRVGHAPLRAEIGMRVLGMSDEMPERPGVDIRQTLQQKAKPTEPIESNQPSKPPIDPWLQSLESDIAKALTNPAEDTD